MRGGPLKLNARRRSLVAVLIPVRRWYVNVHIVFVEIAGAKGVFNLRIERDGHGECEVSTRWCVPPNEDASELYRLPDFGHGVVTTKKYSTAAVAL